MDDGNTEGKSEDKAGFGFTVDGNLITMFSITRRIRERIKRERERIKFHLTVGYLEAKTEVFQSLFPGNVKIKRVATGFDFTEGPIWFAEENHLLFSDIPANRILKLTSGSHTTIVRQPSGNSNGLTRDEKGRLIACEHSNRRVTRTEEDGSITVLADKFQGMKLNSPNDVVVKSDGAVYFTDPPYGLKRNIKEQPIHGVYRISPDGKEIIVVADDFEGPNGLAFSPDEKKLYINDSARFHIRVFSVRADGTLSGGRLFHDMDIRKSGVSDRLKAPDGMKVDVLGHIYCTGPEGIWVFDADGHHLGTIVTPERSANCAWGDDDWRSLYITANTSIYKIRVNIPGVKV